MAEHPRYTRPLTAPADAFDYPIAAGFAHASRTVETSFASLHRVLLEMDGMSSAKDEWLRQRCVDGRSWRELEQQPGYPGRKTALAAMRRQMADILQHETAQARFAIAQLAATVRSCR